MDLSTDGLNPSKVLDSLKSHVLPRGAKVDQYRSDPYLSMKYKGRASLCLTDARYTREPFQLSSGGIISFWPQKDQASELEEALLNPLRELNGAFFTVTQRKPAVLGTRGAFVLDADIGPKSDLSPPQSLEQTTGPLTTEVRETMHKRRISFDQKFAQLLSAERQGAARAFDDLLNDVESALSHLLIIPTVKWDPEDREVISKILTFVKKRLRREGAPVGQKLRYVHWLRSLASKNDQETFDSIKKRFMGQLKSLFRRGIPEFETNRDFFSLLQEFNGYSLKFMKGICDEIIKSTDNRSGVVSIYVEFKKMIPEDLHELVKYLFKRKIKAEKSGDENARRNADILHKEAEATERLAELS
jgi:hypothetical protein